MSDVELASQILFALLSPGCNSPLRTVFVRLSEATELPFTASRSLLYSGDATEALDAPAEADAAAARADATGCPVLLCKVTCGYKFQANPLLRRTRRDLLAALPNRLLPPLIRCLSRLQIRPAATASCNAYNNGSNTIAPGSVTIGASSLLRAGQRAAYHFCHTPAVWGTSICTVMLQTLRPAPQAARDFILEAELKVYHHVV